MLDSLFGSKTAERVLLYLRNYGEGHASEIATTFSIPVSMVQKQLLKYEAGGVLVALPKGRTRLYTWNPRFYFREELQSLLDKALNSVPDEERSKYYRKRTRPRRQGKPM